MTVYRGAMLAVLVLECIFTPLFIRAQWPQKTRKSLILKMICSTLFVLMGVFAMLDARNTSAFAILMICGLCASWLGDLFLHVSPKELFFLLGLLSFLAGHVFYASAYSAAITACFPGARFFNLYEVLAVVVIVGVSFILQKTRLKIKMGKASIPVFAYTTILVVMLVKACSLGMRYAMAGLENSVAVALLLCVGAVLFVLSDSSLLFILFDGKKTFRLKLFNLVTYYGAQIMLAASIFFIR